MFRKSSKSCTTRAFIPLPCTDRMGICGIIAEYDPLHNGHAWHLAEARRLTRADDIVCVISGCFTQRGMPALLSPHVRAEMALRAGADLIMQLPVSFSVCEAERFALGGVAVLRQLGADSLCFGVEPAGIPLITPAAELLEHPTAAYRDRLRALLDTGISFAAAQGQALAEALHADAAALAQPNTALAICYVRAILRLNASITPVPVPRTGDYHAEELARGIPPSASAVRAACLRDEWDSVRAAMPEEAFRLLKNEFERGRWHNPGALDALLRWQLRKEADFSHLPGLSEGLENRLPGAASCLTREEMAHAIKSKRYSYARVNRLLTHALLETEAERLSPLPPHAYVLGFRRGASALLKNKNTDAFTLYARTPRNAASYEMTLDIRADDLWNLGAGQPFGAIYREKPVIL